MITYKDGYKYTLEETYTVQTPIKSYYIKHEYFKLSPGGQLTILKNYSWDGATLFPDIKSVIRGSLAHDCLYQAFKLKLLPLSLRPLADKLLKDNCIEDGASRILANFIYVGVRSLGDILNKDEPKVKVAP